MSFLSELKFHIETFFKVPVSFKDNVLLTSKDEAKIFFNYFVKNNIKLIIRICESLRNLFVCNDFKLYFQNKNRVITIINGDTMYIHGNKIYAGMAHNHLLKYVNWDNTCSKNDLNNKEVNNLYDLCGRENIVINETLSENAKKLLLNILDNTDGIEVTNVTKENRSEIIYLSTDDENEDDQILNFSDGCERKVILSTNTRNNFMTKTSKSVLRPVIIDGCNIAFAHGCGNFNPRGIDIAVKYFIDRGHDHVYVLVPRHRQIEGGSIFEKLEKSKHLIYTPSRIINNKRETSYEDKLILEAALGHNGVVISNDQYRDLLHIQKFQDIIINRLIPYTFVGDLFMIPDDPKGQLGPDLRTMLSLPFYSTKESGESSSGYIKNSNKKKKRLLNKFKPQSIRKKRLMKTRCLKTT